VPVSGLGSNLQSILDACASETVDARVVLVLSNREGAPALGRAERAGVPHAIFAMRDKSERAATHAAMAQAIANAGARLVALAGFAHILAPRFFAPPPGLPLTNRP